MERKKNKKLLVVCTIMTVCFIAWRARPSQGSVRRFEIKPEISLPESRTDAARAIDAYESVTNRLMDMTERNLTGINADVKDIARMLVTIDLKLTELSKRMSKMEGAIIAGALRTDTTLKSPVEDAKVRNHRSVDGKTCEVPKGNRKTAKPRRKRIP